jgi:ribonuclease H / adenosylcobalamin/alpha-ribazole phosphatase
MVCSIWAQPLSSNALVFQWLWFKQRPVFASIATRQMRLLPALKVLAITAQSQHGLGLRKLLRRRLPRPGYFTSATRVYFRHMGHRTTVGGIVLTEPKVIRGKEICHSPTHRHPLNRAAVVRCHPHLDAGRQHRPGCPLLTRQFRYVAAVPLSTVLLCIGSAAAWAEESIVIDFVRHGQSVANAEGLIDTSVPGTALTQLGQEQAQAVANVLAPEGPFAGIFASQMIRTQQTAAPLAALLGMNVQVLPGLNEISAGAFNGLPEFSFQGLLYLLGPIAWALGLPLAPMLAPGSTDVNGVVFNERFSGALQTMYGNALTNPVRAADGKITEVAFSSEFAIEVGTMMNVKNPDPLLMLIDPLPNTGIVVIQGNPQDGWTLVSWNGMPVSPGRADARISPETMGLCLLLKVPTGNGPCPNRV